MSIVASLKTSAVTNQNCKVVFQQPSPREGASGQKRRKRERLYGKRRCSNRILAWGGVGWKPFPNGMCELHYYFQNFSDISRWFQNFLDGFKTVRIFPYDFKIFQSVSKLNRHSQINSNYPDGFKIVWLYPDYLNIFQMVSKLISKLFGHFQMISKLSSQSQNCPNIPIIY